MKEGEGTKQKHIDTDNSVVIARGKRKWVEVGRRRNGAFAFGNGCMMQCAHDVLLSCTLETCMVL